MGSGGGVMTGGGAWPSTSTGGMGAGKVGLAFVGSLLLELCCSFVCRFSNTMATAAMMARLSDQSTKRMGPRRFGAVTYCGARARGLGGGGAAGMGALAARGVGLGFGFGLGAAAIGSLVRIGCFAFGAAGAGAGAAEAGGSLTGLLHLAQTEVPPAE